MYYFKRWRHKVANDYIPWLWYGRPCDGFDALYKKCLLVVNYFLAVRKRPKSEYELNQNWIKCLIVIGNTLNQIV